MMSTNKPRFGELGRLDYGNVKMTGPISDLNYIRDLIQEAERKAVRKTAKVPPLEGSQLEDFTKDWG